MTEETWLYRAPVVASAAHDWAVVSVKALRGKGHETPLAQVRLLKLPQSGAQPRWEARSAWLSYAKGRWIKGKGLDRALEDEMDLGALEVMVKELLDAHGQAEAAGTA